jgi:hypothetical protein
MTATTLGRWRTLGAGGELAALEHGRAGEQRAGQGGGIAVLALGQEVPAVQRLSPPMAGPHQIW